MTDYQQFMKDLDKRLKTADVLATDHRVGAKAVKARKLHEVTVPSNVLAFWAILINPVSGKALAAGTRGDKPTASALSLTELGNFVFRFNSMNSSKSSSVESRQPSQRVTLTGS